MYMNYRKLNKVGYELVDVNIVQAPISYINHRKECDPYTTIANKRVLPVIVSPMASVTDENNWKTWLDAGFMSVVPRSVDYNKRLELCHEVFASFSLDESEGLLTSEDFNKALIDNDTFSYICIDIAHGTMNRLYQICRNLKDKFGNKIVIMTGNIANPEAYPFYARAGVDYIRLSVGSGSRCTTSCNVGVHYPVATLIDETNQKRQVWISENTGPAPKLIVDGGISNFDDIQKSIALGADFVMCGNLFARAEEACGSVGYMHPDNLNMTDAIPENVYLEKVNCLETTLKEMIQDCEKYKVEIAQVTESLTKMRKRKPYREYYGMSTKQAQRVTGGKGNKTSEGISRPIPVEYPINKWADNMKSYFISAMSYVGAENIEELRTNTELIINLSGDKSFRK